MSLEELAGLGAETVDWRYSPEGRALTAYPARLRRGEAVLEGGVRIVQGRVMVDPKALAELSGGTAAAIPWMVTPRWRLGGRSRRNLGVPGRRPGRRMAVALVRRGVGGGDGPGLTHSGQRNPLRRLRRHPVPRMAIFRKPVRPVRVRSSSKPIRALSWTTGL